MEKAKVYFTRNITPENVVRLYSLLGKQLPGKVAVKVHSGEKGNQNFLRPEFMKPMIDAVKGTVVECNTAYGGERNTSEKHRKLIAYHGWSHYFDVDRMDAEGPDLELAIPEGRKIHKNLVGKNLAAYDSAYKQNTNQYYNNSGCNCTDYYLFLFVITTLFTSTFFRLLYF